MPECRDPGVIDPAVIFDTLATGVLPPERLGGVTRWTFIQVQQAFDRTDRLVAARLVLTDQCLADLAAHLGAELLARATLASLITRGSA